MMIVDAPVTLALPPAYDTLSPLYDDKDLPKYGEVVGAQPPLSQEPPPSYDSQSTLTYGTQQVQNTSSAPASHDT